MPIAADEVVIRISLSGFARKDFEFGLPPLHHSIPFITLQPTIPPNFQPRPRAVLSVVALSVLVTRLRFSRSWSAAGSSLMLASRRPVPADIIREVLAKDLRV